MSEETKPALECRKVTVNYGQVTALEDVCARFAQGQIHAVVGQNGAGKTTFARVAAGLVRPTSGSVMVMEREVRTGHVNDSRAAGVELVHQSFALPPSFTVVEAMEFSVAGTGGFYSRKCLKNKWHDHLRDLDITVDLGERLRALPVETQQGIEIARALVTDAKVLILDEPTAVLSPAGIDVLFNRVRRLKERGVTVIMILHKIREVLAIADTVTVLRGGRKIEGPLSVKELSSERLAKLIIGDSVVRAPNALGQSVPVQVTQSDIAGSGKISEPSKPKALELRGVSTNPDSEGMPLDDVDLEIRAGEIVGIAGVEGNGQRTLVRTIAALSDMHSGHLCLGGQDVTDQSLSGRRNSGLRIIPFERNVEGLSLTSSLWENWSARALLQNGLLRFIAPSAIRRDCDQSLKSWGVRFHSPGQRAESLSGGNAQKVIFAREIDPDAKLIIAAQPTRGLDIGATAFVWQTLREARDRGAAVLLISSDLDELFDISDRVLVMLSGRINGEFSAPYDMLSVGRAMTDAATEVTA
ncbi:ABC transporter ATP-binding protein [Agrobacterium larrymoorei]|uniref:ATP-binding cassette domain-containing protein n=1 Tax=Agrobacterium larrymoorei TaxID=160699 RepID=A0A4D7DUI1_9HYPH|nr:ATP-binding cassette domain-containing protein [Agrobacterium larrymoorei]QYA10412.1 ATP-binding cassette domain-containing protein [Agrobacterium larrymoorei]